MSYLLLILWPWAMASGCWLLRRFPTLATLLATLAVLGEGLLLLRAPVGEPLRLLGASMLLTGNGRLLLALLVGSAMVDVAVSGAFGAGLQTPAIRLILLGCGAAIALFSDPVIGSLALLGAGVLAVFTIADIAPDSPNLLAPTTLVMALRYLMLWVVGLTVLFVGLVLVGSAAPATWISLLLGLGLVMLLGLIPFHFVHSALAVSVPLPTVGLVRGLLFLGILLLLTIADAQPSDNRAQQLRQAFGFLTALGMPLVALRSPLPRRMIVLLHAQLGLVVVYLASAATPFTPVTLAPVTAHVLATALVIVSLSVLERQVAGRRETRPLWRERPLGAVGLAVGLLALLGLLPIGRAVSLALLVDALLPAPILLVIALVALGLMVYVGLGVIYDLLLQPPQTTPLPLPSKVSLLPAVIPPYAPIALRLVLVLLILVTLVGGLFPQEVLEQLAMAMLY